MAGSLVCRDTGARFSLDTLIWRSPAVVSQGPFVPAGLLDIELEVGPGTFPLEAIARRPWSMWRYREALPVPVGGEVSLGEGMTPLVDWDGGDMCEGVLVKQDTLFPSGSYKDRGAAVMVSQCKALGVSSVVEDSSGNAGSSFAMYCARAGIACEIYVPESTSPAKLVQVRGAGARLVRVPGDRMATTSAIWEAAQRAYYVSHAWNPFFFHGTKTFAFEVCEQLGWRAPGAVIVPTGNGTLLLGCWIGFEELRRAGVIDSVPRLVAVQAQGCQPLARAWAGRVRGAGTFGEAFPAGVLAGVMQYTQSSPTIAEGIAIARPLRASQCLEAVWSTGGTIVTIDDEATIASLRVALARGLFIEPTCASGLAAIGAIRREISSLEGTIVVAATGHGLKTSDTIAKLLVP